MYKSVKCVMEIHMDNYPIQKKRMLSWSARQKLPQVTNCSSFACIKQQDPLKHSQTGGQKYPCTTKNK